MRFRSSSLATTTFLAGLAVLGGILAYAARHTHGTTAVLPSRTATATHGAAHRHDQVAASQAKRSAWLPIHQVLPQLDGPLSDWRTFKPDTITVAPYPGYNLPFHRVSVTEKNGITTWVGRNGMQGTFLVGIGKKDSWVGCLVTMGSTFDIHVLNDAVRVTEHSGSISCGVRPAAVQAAPAPTQSAPIVSAPGAHVEALVAQPPQPQGGKAVGGAGLNSAVMVGDQEQVNYGFGDGTGPSHIAGTTAPSGTTIYNVNVAFFYTSDSIDYEVYIGDVADASQVPAYMDSLYRSYIVAGNLIAQQSGVNDLNWVCVGVFQAPDYTRTPNGSFTDNKGVTHTEYDPAQDLNAFVTVVGQTPTTFATFVQKTVQTTSANQWQLLEPYTHPYGGLADDPGHSSIVGTGAGAYNTLHEMGHNFGLQHDRADAPISVDGDGLYWYGYLFPYNAKNFGGPDFQYHPGDIMSYGGPILPYYANPNISFTGNELGAGSVSDNNRYALGVAVDQPKAADAALYLSQHVAALALATYKETLAAAGWPGLNGWLGGGALLDPNQAPKVVPSFAILPVAAQTASAGGEIHLTAAAAAGTSVTYQWRRDGVDIAGATSATLDIANVTSADNGIYDVAIANDVATVISRGATVNVLSAQAYGALSSQLIAISTRSQVGTDSGVQDAGFVITGTTPKTVLIRASGPALIPYGVAGTLADPVLTLYNSKSLPIDTNDDWSSDPTNAAAISAAAAQVGDFPFASGSKDAALLVTLDPGLYTAIVGGKSGGTGVAMVEVYDVSQPGGKFVGISTRSPVGAGSAVQVAGFVITGTAPKTVLIRAAGPALVPQGVTGTLADPVLTLFDANSQVIGVNSNGWSSDPTSAAAISAAAVKVGDFAFASGSKDAALLVTLNPGLYTAQVSSGDGTTGVALVEVYDASN